MKTCSRCKINTENVAIEQIYFFYYCPKCGILERRPSLESKPDKLWIPEILTDYPDKITEDRAMIHQIIMTMLDNPDKHGIYPTGKCYNEFEELLLKVRAQALGYAWSIACGYMEDCEDIREINQAGFLAKALKQLNKGE